MKKMMMFAALAAVAGMTAGCFTSAVAYTEKTNPDGTKTVSKVKIVGTGDKASQIAAEGLFADGAKDDLGAGVKNASATQQSTGIKETLEGMGVLLTGIGSLVARTQGIPTASAAVADVAKKTVVQPEPVTITDSESAAPEQKEARTVPGTGVVTVAVLGDRASCSLCRALWSYLDPVALSASLCGASVVDADRTDAPAAFGKYRPSSGFSYPLVRVYDGGALKGEFVARGLDQKTITDKVSGLAPSCAEK